MMLEGAITYARQHKEQHLAALIDWLRIASISTLPEHARDVRQAAIWAVEKLRRMGFPHVELVETARHPLVYAEWIADQLSPTLLVYGHYDVQPIDPLEDWARAPFEPTVAGDNLYARGASDDKGQAYAILAALQSYLQTAGTLPVNLKLILEGEEEISSPNLAPYLREHVNQLAADAILIADQDMLDPHHPVIMYGVRGSLYVEIEVRGPTRDLHSGTFGGSVDNPFNVLARLLASLQDAHSRRLLIPGFYNRVQEIDEGERALIAQMPINEQLALHLTGAPALGGEHGYSLAERISVRPTLDVHGIAGGFTGEGKKTVIPYVATAKVSMRLVPDQRPEEVFDLLRDHLEKLAPPTVQLQVRKIGQAYPVKVDIQSPAVQMAVEAYLRGFGAQPIFLRGGGSLPIVHDMISVLSPPGGAPIPVVMIGFGLPDDCTHAPNEKFYLPNFYHGIETIIHYINLFASTGISGS